MKRLDLKMPLLALAMVVIVICFALLQGGAPW